MDPVVILAVTVASCYSFGFIFIICDIFQRITNAFDEIFDEIMQSNWYLFPQEIKESLPIILIELQQPIVMHIFGSICASRDTFKRVNRNTIPQMAINILISIVIQKVNAKFLVYFLDRQYWILLFYGAA